MKKFIRFPEIERLSNIYKSISRKVCFTGLDENGNAVYDDNRKRPIITFTGTVKIHGTNSGVCMNNSGEIWSQSRTNIITIDKDNAGFAFFVEKNKEVFKKLLKKYHTGKKNEIISIFGEWFGKSIQSKVAVSKLPDKKFAIFAIKRTLITEDETKPIVEWLLSDKFKDINIPKHNIFNVYLFGQYSIDIDFNDYKKSLPELNRIKDNVEKQCPVGMYFGVDGIGEGVVWETRIENSIRLVFKVKGEKHSKGKKPSKEKRIIDNAKLKKISDIAYKVTPLWRLDQFVTDICNLNNGGNIEMTKMGEYIKAVIKDIHKEDMDILIKSGYEPKEFNKAISTIARKYFIDRFENDENY